MADPRGESRYSGGATFGGGRSRSAASRSPSRQQAIQNVQEREERAQAQPMIPSLAAIIGGGIGSMMRQNIIRQIEAGGTPVRENGMVIGVMSNGRYTGRQREADRLAMQEANRGDGAAQAAQMGAGAPQPDQPAAAPAPPVVRRSALAQQIEEENRRRRAAGLRRLGARTLLSGDRFTADTLGAG